MNRFPHNLEAVISNFFLEKLEGLQPIQSYQEILKLMGNDSMMRIPTREISPTHLLGEADVRAPQGASGVTDLTHLEALIKTRELANQMAVSGCERGCFQGVTVL